MFRVFLVFCSLVAASPRWGGIVPFSRFHSSLDSYVIKNTPVEHPGPVCSQIRGMECANQLPAAIDLFVSEGGRMAVADMVNHLGVRGKKDRECVRYFLWRLHRKIYIPETMLRWLLEINEFGVSVSSAEFYALSGKHRTNMRIKKVYSPPVMLNTGLPKKPENNFFLMSRCDLQMWYVDILMRYVGRTIPEMNLSVVPNESVSVAAHFQKNELILAPSSEDVLRVIRSERERIGILVVGDSSDRNIANTQNIPAVYWDSTASSESDALMNDAPLTDVQFWIPHPVPEDHDVYENDYHGEYQNESLLPAPQFTSGKRTLQLLFDDEVNEAL